MNSEHSGSTERPAGAATGILMRLPGMLLLAGGPISVARDPDAVLRVVTGVVAASFGLLLICGLYSLQPNEGMAILLFGACRGADRKAAVVSNPVLCADRAAQPVVNTGTLYG